MPRRPRAKRPSKAVLRDLLKQFHESKDPKLRDELILAYSDLAAYLARKFANRGEPVEDLIQVASIGLLKAMDRFDPTRETEFTTYATATVVGEIKRHFRDKFWAIRVPRRLRELNNSLMKTVETLAQRVGRSPTIPELVEETGVPFEDIVEAFELGHAYSPISWDAEGDDEHGTVASSLGGEDPELARMEDRHTLEGALQRLSDRQRDVIRLRYYDGLSQADIATRLGISQIHVSRIQREALRRLRFLIEA